MKTFNRIKGRWLIPLLMALALFRPFSGFAQEDTNDFWWLELLPPGCCLGSWSFEDTNWDSDFGFAPLSYTNIVQVPDWDDNALQMDATNAAWLTYSIKEYAPGYGEYTNLTLDTGSIEFWFVANWESADTNFYGTGPGDWGRFIDIGEWTTNADYGWWSLYLNPSGTGIYFSSGTNGVRTNYLNTSISWDSSTWHMLDLTYSPSNSFIYVDGQLAASGPGVCYVPSGSILTNGFAIGSDLGTGMQQAHGQFDDLYTYNYQLSADDVTDDYAEIFPELPVVGFHPADDGPIPPGGGTNGGDGGYGADYGPIEPDYGTNLWIAQEALSEGNFSGILSNTIPDTEYLLFSANSIVTPVQWVPNSVVVGTEGANWTPWTVPYDPLNNFFLTALSQQEDSATGIPDWWLLKYFGEYTNVDSFSDPIGDGYTIYQDYINGWSPLNWVQPPAPQGFRVDSFNSASGTATLSWLPSPGPVTSYTLYGWNPETDTLNVNLSANMTSYTNTGSSFGVTYAIFANYAGGSSPWSWTSVQQYGFSAEIIAGPLGSAYLAVSGMPADTYELEVSRTDYVASAYFDDNSYNTNFYITINNPTNGFYPLPNVMLPPDVYVQEYSIINYGIYGYQTTENWYVQAMESNGLPNTVNYGSSIGSSYTSSEDGYESSWTVPPYFDGREQLKQNLIFLLREPGSQPFGYATYTNIDDYIVPFAGIANYSSQPTNYAYAGFYDTESVWSGYNMTAGNSELEACRPFYENYIYANFMYNPGDLGEDNTLARVNEIPGVFPITQLLFLILTNNPPLLFQQPSVSETAIPPQLNDTQSLYSVSFEPWDGDALYTNGVFYFMTGVGFTYTTTNVGPPVDYIDAYTMENSPVNYFGIPILSASAAYFDENYNLNYETMSPGDTLTCVQSDMFPQAAQPGLQPSEYDFWLPSLDSLPGGNNFSPTNTSRQPLIVAVGNPANIAGYAKLAVTNGYPGVYGYLGQYFTNAFQIDANATVTTNSTGILSSFGQFFATEPGPVALVTMPDPDSGQQGTGTVYCVSLNVDKNHDGVMDTNFSGLDTTSLASLDEIWINNDYDFSSGSADLYGHDIQNDYRGNYQDPAISCPRDLEDWFRLWICGLPSLPTGQGYNVTMSMSAISGNPAINMVNSVETNGGMLYLTDTNTAFAQCEDYYGLGPGQKYRTINTTNSLTLPANLFTNAGNKYFLFEGAGIGEGQLTMTVSQNGNAIAQSFVYLDIHDVKDFYERAYITNNSSGAISNWTSQLECVQEASSSALGDDTNIIVMVHGINVGTWEWLTDSDTVFKRLYWSGFNGRFCTVKWPCDYLTPPQPVTFDVFNLSEAVAYKASTSLTTYLNQLHARFPGYQLDIYAHSQGNAIVSEAVMNGAPVNNYLLTQGAISDGAYDVNATNYPEFTNQEVVSQITPQWQPMGYRGIYTNLTARLVNFYNPLDPVLAVWNLDQELEKPSSNYSYDGTNCWYSDSIFSKHLVTDFEETRAMVSRSRTLSIGTSGPDTAHGVILSGVNLNTQYNFGYDFPADHSAQWQRPIQTTRPYFQQVLRSYQIEPAP